MKLDELRKFAQEVRAAAGEQPAPVRILVDVLQVVALCDAAKALVLLYDNIAEFGTITDGEILDPADAALTAIREAGIEL